MPPAGRDRIIDAEATFVSLDHREYMREPGQYRLKFGDGWTTTVKVLIAINAAIFLMDASLPQGVEPATPSPPGGDESVETGQKDDETGGAPPKGDKGTTRIGAALSLTLWQLKEGQIWRLVTYQFAHGGFFHVLMNMLALYMLGPTVERHLGRKSFLKLYLLGGIGGGAVVMGMAGAMPDYRVTLLGASAAVCALILPMFRANPNIRLMFIDKNTFIWLFLLISGALTLAEIINGAPLASTRISHAAHLGGFAVGWVWSRRPIRRAGTMPAPRRGQWAKKREKELVELRTDEQEVDRILAKVKSEGLASLTRKEKRSLQRATDREREREQSIGGP